MARRDDDDEIVYVRDEGGSGIKWFLAGAAVGGLRALTVSARVANEPLFLQRRIPADVRDTLRGALIALDSPEALAGLADATGFARRRSPSEREEAA